MVWNPTWDSVWFRFFRFTHPIIQPIPGEAAQNVPALAFFGWPLVPFLPRPQSQILTYASRHFDGPPMGSLRRPWSNLVGFWCTRFEKTNPNSMALADQTSWKRNYQLKYNRKRDKKSHGIAVRWFQLITSEVSKHSRTCFFFLLSSSWSQWFVSTCAV